MERNTVTKICHLQTGDRFYKQTDKQKRLWTKVEIHPALKVGTVARHEHFALMDGKRHPEPMKGETPVVFLRHAQDNAT